jgi:hypothetical protein
LVRVLKLLVVRKDCTFSAYSFESMIIRTIYVVDLLMMGGVRSKHVEESNLTLRRLMSYILMFLDHTQRRSTVGRTPLDE